MANTCYELLKQKVAKDAFVVYYGHKIPMSDFLRDIDGFASGLLKLNLKKGDVVTIWLPSCPQGLVAFYACSKLGLTANIVHPLIPLNLLAQNLQKVGSKALLFYDALVKDERPLAELNQTLVRCSIADYVTVRKGAFKLYAWAIGKRNKNILTYKKMCHNSVGPVLGDGSDLVCLMHSGGTSGLPKIVKLTNQAFNDTAKDTVAMYHPTVDSKCYNLATLPIFHAYGLCAGVHTPLILGTSLILVPKFSPSTVASYFKKYKITIWSVVPAMLKKMLKAEKFDDKSLADLDVIWCGGDVVDESLVGQVDGILQKYCTRARLMRGYGLTEVCGVCVVNSFDFYRAESCGKPLPNTFVQIWDDNQNVLPAGECGEIALCARGNTAGYVEGDTCLVEKDGKNWVLTGDIGRLDEDGFLYVIDRKKRTLKIAAVNVFPSQIEACVKKLPFVDEACAVGYSVQGKPFVKLYITLKDDSVPAESAKQQALDACTQNLIKYSVPRVVEVLEKMPRTPLGKVDFKSLENLNK